MASWSGRNRVSSPDQPRRESVYRTAQAKYVANRDKDASAPWRQWLRERYAKHWYLLGCLVLDIAAAATILQNGVPPTQWWQYVLAVLALVALSYVEYKGLQRFWPPEYAEPES